MARWWLVCLGMILPLSGCGSGGSGAPIYDPSAAKPPACMHGGQSRALPAGFPHQFPFPAGTSITTRGRRGVATTIGGIIPSTSFKETAAFFPRELAKVGFTIVYSEADPPRDAEGSYRGQGYAGRWTLEHVASCPSAIRFAAFAQPSKP